MSTELEVLAANLYEAEKTLTTVVLFDRHYERIKAARDQARERLDQALEAKRQRRKEMNSKLEEWRKLGKPGSLKAYLGLGVE